MKLIIFSSFLIKLLLQIYSRHKPITDHKYKHTHLSSLKTTYLSLCVPSSTQFSLLSEVRGLVTPQDLERFDGMVLRREIQALKARQGTAGATALQPDSLSMVSYPDTLTSSSASFMTNTTLSSARVRQVY